MKTTLDITDGLLMQARALASREGTTLRALTEEGLSLVLNIHSNRRRRRIRPVTFKDRGLSREFRDASREEILSAAYQKRGS